MKFQQLTVENFLSIGSATINFDNAGLVLVQGENLDSDVANSNMSGKSALFVDAWLWTIFGKTARGVRGENVVRNGSEGGCCCSLTFTTNNCSFCITRYLNHEFFNNNLNLYQLNSDNQWNDISNPDKRVTQKEIERLVGFPMKVALNAVVLGQKSIAFATMSDSERKSTFEQVLGFDFLSTAEKKAKEGVKAVEAELSGIQIVQRSLHEQEAALAIKLNNLDKQSKEWVEAERKRRDTLRIQLRTVEFNLAEEAKKRTRIATELIDCQKALAQEVELYNKEYTEWSRRINSKKELEGELRARDALLDPVLLQSKRSALEQKVDTEGARYLKLIATAELPFNQNCPTCKQVLPANQIAVLQVQQAAEVERLKQEYADTIQRLSHEIAEITEKFEQLHLSEELRNRLALLNNEESLLRESLFTFNTQKDKLDNKVKKLLSDHRSCESAYLNLEANKIQITNNLTAPAVNPYEVAIQQTTSSLEEVKEKLVAVNRDIVNTQDKLRLYKFWVTGFGKRGIQSLMLDSIMPYLNECVEEYAQIVWGSEIEISFRAQRELATGGLREDFHIEAKSKYGTQCYDGASAGESERIDICVALALQDLVISRYGGEFSPCILDEVCRYLDAEGAECYFRLLEYLAHKRSSVFVITHSSHLEPLFSRTVTIRKQNGVSELVA